MTGYLTTANGDVWRLPALLEWEILRTDGDGCDSARVIFLYEPARLEVLKKAVRLRLEKDGKTAFFGVVDEFTAQVGEKGRLVEISARGLMALLLDSQLRAAEYTSFGEKDAIAKLVTPFGITKVQSGGLGDVRNFSWETAASPWQVLSGYCRHAGGVRPQFTADGTLMLKREERPLWLLTDSSAYLSARLRHRRYGVIGRQIVVTSGKNAETVENEAALALKLNTQKVAVKTGKTLKASYRTGEQRVRESMEGAAVLTVTVPGLFEAEPGDRVRVNMKKTGFAGDMLLRSVKTSCNADGQQTILELEGAWG